MGRGISRRSFLRTATLGSAALALAPRLAGQAAKLGRKPNLIVFLPDEQQAGTLACYGASRPYAPNLDKLASDAVVFDRAYVTHPICTPSRSSLLTGTWPHKNGCTYNGAKLGPELLCLPELLADNDYRTGYFGKWHLGDELSAQHGFEEWISIRDRRLMKEPNKSPSQRLSDYGKFLVEKGFTPDTRDGTFSPKFASRLPIELSKPVFLANRACDFLDRHRREPFILFVAFFEPHPPYYGPLNQEHPRNEVELPESASEIFGADMPLRYRFIQEKQQTRMGWSVESHRQRKQHYLGLVTEVDRSIGVVLSHLEQAGLADDTVVVHTSDHGDMMSAHGLYGKTVMFEEAARVPYIVRVPGMRGSNRVTQAVGHIDFVPTMLELLGKPSHAQCAGKSRVSSMRGEKIAPEPVFLQWAPNASANTGKGISKLAPPARIKAAVQESTRTIVAPDGWKLSIRDKDKSELYNLTLDPGERHNLYNDAASREVIARLSGDIHRWQESMDDRLKV